MDLSVFVQTLPFNYRAWHVGAGSLGSYNNNGPGIEVCEPSGGQTYSGGVMKGLDKENTEITLIRQELLLLKYLVISVKSMILTRIPQL